MTGRDVVGVLVPINADGPMAPPESRPIGRAALQLAKEGLTVVFGDQLVRGKMTGVVAVEGGWRRVSDVLVCGIHDRYPSQRRAERYRTLLAELAGLPLANSPQMTALCRDKLLCQRVLEDAGVHAVPTVVDQVEQFEDALARWGAGFLKPRFGALGIGVRRVCPAEPLDDQLPGVVDGRLEPALLQRAISAPAGWAGWSVRVLTQRCVDSGWVQGEPVVRRHRTDPVVNAARGAEIAAGSDVLSPDTLASVRSLSMECVAALAQQEGGHLAVEFGVDVVIDAALRPWVVEVNSRPRGRMEVLAEMNPARFAGLHTEACARPLRTLARLAMGEPGGEP